MNQPTLGFNFVDVSYFDVCGFPADLTLNVGAVIGDNELDSFRVTRQDPENVYLTFPYQIDNGSQYPGDEHVFDFAVRITSDLQSCTDEVSETKDMVAEAKFQLPTFDIALNSQTLVVGSQVSRTTSEFYPTTAKAGDFIDVVYIPKIGDSNVGIREGSDVTIDGEATEFYSTVELFETEISTGAQTDTDKWVVVKTGGVETFVQHMYLYDTEISYDNSFITPTEVEMDRETLFTVTLLDSSNNPAPPTETQYFSVSWIPNEFYELFLDYSPTSYALTCGLEEAHICTAIVPTWDVYNIMSQGGLDTNYLVVDMWDSAVTLTDSLHVAWDEIHLIYMPSSLSDEDLPATITAGTDVDFAVRFKDEDGFYLNNDYSPVFFNNTACDYARMPVENPTYTQWNCTASETIAGSKNNTVTYYYDFAGDVGVADAIGIDYIVEAADPVSVTSHTTELTVGGTATVNLTLKDTYGNQILKDLSVKAGFGTTTADADTACVFSSTTNTFGCNVTVPCTAATTNLHITWGTTPTALSPIAFTLSADVLNYTTSIESINLDSVEAGATPTFTLYPKDGCYNVLTDVTSMSASWAGATAATQAMSFTGATSSNGYLLSCSTAEAGTPGVDTLMTFNNDTTKQAKVTITDAVPSLTTSSQAIYRTGSTTETTHLAGDSVDIIVTLKDSNGYPIAGVGERDYIVTFKRTGETDIDMPKVTNTNTYKVTAFTLPTTVGNMDYSINISEQDVSDSVQKSIPVVKGSAPSLYDETMSSLSHSIVAAYPAKAQSTYGPTTCTAGETTTFSVTLKDQYSNPVMFTSGTDTFPSLSVGGTAQTTTLTASTTSTYETDMECPQTAGAFNLDVSTLWDTYTTSTGSWTHTSGVTSNAAAIDNTVSSLVLSSSAFTVDDSVTATFTSKDQYGNV
ncbi:hypothetical protein KIPB_005329, partial [Kipferlia bialata]|eukprot:g5329.t1